MRGNVIVLHARDADKAFKAAGGRDFTWLYLGRDTAEREKIVRRLGGEKRYATGSLLQETAHEQKQPLLDFLAGLGKEQPDQLHWWASNTAYRNPLSSGLFLLWCYASVFEKVGGKGEWDGKKHLVVIVEDRWLYKALWQRYRDDGYRFLSGRTVWPQLWKLYLKLVAVRILFICRAGKHYLRARRTKPGINDFIAKERNTVYVYSWIQERSFTATGEFRDVYFGRLPDILLKNGNKVAYLAPPFLPPALKQKCALHKGLDFTFLDGYFSPGVILRSAFACLRIRSGGEEKWLGTLLRRQAATEVGFQNHIVYYYAFRKWLKENAVDKAAIVYPFENQPWEKMLCRAVADSGKKIRLVGYQHSTVPPLLVNYFAGKGEAATMPLPHRIVVDGKRALETLQNAGYGGLEMFNGGALRFEGLQDRSKHHHAKEGNKAPVVLVTLPYLIDLVQEMLLAVFRAFGSLQNGPRIIIKFHPAVSPKNLHISLPDFPPHFTLTDKPIGEMLGEIGLVLCSSGNIILEVAAAGVPAVRFRSEQTLCLDELEGLEESIASCYENDMQNVVLSVLKRGEKGSPPDISDKVSGFFAPVDEEVWKEVVKF